MSEASKNPTGSGGATAPLPHAETLLPDWIEAWERSGELVLLLDFDGTLAPIVDQPDRAQMPAATRAALEQLRARPGVQLAVVSGRGLADARARAALPGIAYAGNHGMEIEGPGLSEIHAEAAAARPLLERVLARVTPALADVPGAIVEDKGLTLTVHYRQVEGARVDEVRRAVEAAVAGIDRVRVTTGKAIYEVRPAVSWDKGRAVDFLLRHLEPEPGAPVLYLGDDVTDEDAFLTLRERRRGDGVVVAHSPPAHTAAHAWLRDPEEVGRLLTRLADAAPRG